jgi:RNA polymerase sigma-70 factor (ECF subfamily)
MNNDATQLLQQIADRNESAFEMLFDRYKEQLFHYIFGIVKSREVAEELVTDVFLKIWLGKEVLTEIENFDAFLFRVAYNKSIDFLRKAARDSQFRELLWQKTRLSPGAFADHQVIDREYEKALREALLLLSPQRRLVYSLCREKGFSHLDVARKLQLSKHTISNHIVESQRFIRTYLVSRLDITLSFLLFLFGWC